MDLFCSKISPRNPQHIEYLKTFNCSLVIKKYFSTVFQDISSTTRKALLNIVEDFRSELKRLKYFEVYFARSANTDLKFCNELGWFECEGPFNKKKCTGFHKINPYGSKDARVLFKTWNLDHK